MGKDGTLLAAMTWPNDARLLSMGPLLPVVPIVFSKLRSFHDEPIHLDLCLFASADSVMADWGAVEVAWQAVDGTMRSARPTQLDPSLPGGADRSPISDESHYFGDRASSSVGRILVDSINLPNAQITIRLREVLLPSGLRYSGEFTLGVYTRYEYYLE